MVFTGEVSFQKGEEWDTTGLTFSSTGLWNILGTEIWTEEDDSTSKSFQGRSSRQAGVIWNNLAARWEIAVNFWENLGEDVFQSESTPFVQAHWFPGYNHGPTSISTAMCRVDTSRNYINGVDFGFPDKTAVPVHNFSIGSINSIELPGDLNFSSTNTGDIITLGKISSDDPDSGRWEILGTVKDKTATDKWYIIINREHTEGDVAPRDNFTQAILFEPNRVKGSQLWDSTAYTWDFDFQWQHFQDNIFIAES